MKAYADTNFLARLYLKQLEVEDALALIADVMGGRVDPLPMTWLLEIEVTGALELYVWCSSQGQRPRVTAEQAAVAHADFQSDLHDGLIYGPADLKPRRLVKQSDDLILRHTAKQGSRTYDIIHIASALELSCDEFWTFDRRAAKLAEREGLKVPARLKAAMKKLA
jgi:predicted nucleic acid-binding protein